MIKDPELKEFGTDPQVNYWIRPDAHAGIFPFPSPGANEMIVNYLLESREKFTLVLLVPDDIPEGGTTTIEGNADEMRAIYKN